MLQRVNIAKAPTDVVEGELPAVVADLNQQFTAVKLDLLNQWLKGSEAAQAFTQKYKGSLAGTKVRVAQASRRTFDVPP